MNNETIELISHDYMTGEDTISAQADIGYNTGWFAIGTTEGSLNNKLITVAGYPTDFKYYQYFASDRIFDCDTYNCFYFADMMRGQSGGPVYDINNTVWAINTY